MALSPPASRGHRALVVVIAVGVLIPLGIALRAVQDAGGNPTVLVAFGEEAQPTREYAEARLDDVYLRALQGHDGKFFFVQANDPWVLDPEENALVLDRPLYRSQRMLYPALAGGLGFFEPEAVVWGMIVVNLVAMAAGTWAVARIAIEMGGSPWWGLAFPLNLGFLSEMLIGGGGVVAAAAAFAAVLFTMRRENIAAIAMLSLAVLAREAMLIAVLGISIWHFAEERRRLGVVTALLPVVPVVAWAAYLRMRIQSGAVAPEVQEIGWPFVGFVEAFESWLGEPINLAAGLAIMAMFALYTRRALISRHVLGWAFLGFVGLGILFTEQVWRSYFDITRAVAPIITSFVLLAFLVGERSAGPVADLPANEQVFG